jgi:hypothetical protein
MRPAGLGRAVDAKPAGSSRRAHGSSARGERTLSIAGGRSVAAAGADDEAPGQASASSWSPPFANEHGATRRRCAVERSVRRSTGAVKRRLAPPLEPPRRSLRRPTRIFPIDARQVGGGAVSRTARWPQGRGGYSDARSPPCQQAERSKLREANRSCSGWRQSCSPGSMRRSGRSCAITATSWRMATRRP